MTPKRPPPPIDPATGRLRDEPERMSVATDRTKNCPVCEGTGTMPVFKSVSVLKSRGQAIEDGHVPCPLCTEAVILPPRRY